MYFPIITDSTKRLPIYLTGIGTMNPQDETVRPEGYPYSQLSLISKGEGRFLCRGQEYSLKKGSSFYFRHDLPHSYYPTDEPFVNHWVTFAGDSCEQLETLLSEDGFCVFTIRQLNQLLPVFERLCAAVQNNESDEVLSALTYQYFLDFLRLKKEQSDNHEERLLPALRFMEEHPEQEHTLDALAALVGMSKYAFCRLFREAKGVTPFTYLLRLRIQQAKYLLISERSLKIAQIAEMTGFHDVSYFCAVFKKTEGITPSAFRNF